MHFIYSDIEEPRSSRSVVPYDRLNATKHWTTHFENYMYLKFLLEAPGSTFLERRRANKEILIADRKMAYWMKHPNFRLEEAEQNKIRIQKNWATKR